MWADLYCSFLLGFRHWSTMNTLGDPLHQPSFWVQIYWPQTFFFCSLSSYYESLLVVIFVIEQCWAVVIILWLLILQRYMAIWCNSLRTILVSICLLLFSLLVLFFLLIWFTLVWGLRYLRVIVSNNKVKRDLLTEANRYQWDSVRMKSITPNYKLSNEYYLHNTPDCGNIF